MFYEGDLPEAKGGRPAKLRRIGPDTVGRAADAEILQRAPNRIPGRGRQAFATGDRGGTGVPQGLPMAQGGPFGHAACGGRGLRAAAQVEMHGRVV